MTATTVMSQRGLSYCLCLEELFVGSCECAEPVSSTPTCHKDSCCDEEKAQSQVDAPSCIDDCVVSLFVDLADYSNFHKSEENQRTLPTLVFISATEATPVVVPAPAASHQTRGPPPRLVIAPAVPLFIRHSVYLI